MLDGGALDRLCASVGAENLIGVLDQVFQSASQARDDLRDEAARGDVHRVAEIAHRVKSDCSYMGATGLVERLADLEGRVRAGTHDGVLAGIPSLLGALQGFLDDVRHERETRTGRP